MSLFANVVTAEETIGYEYDALGRLVLVDSSIHGQTEYEFDAAGNRTHAGEVVEQPVNTPPLAVHDMLEVERYRSASAYVLSNDSDPDGDALTITSAVINRSIATVSISANKQYIVVNAHTVGTASISYTISDGRGGEDTSVVFLTVTGDSGPGGPGLDPL